MMRAALIATLVAAVAAPSFAQAPESAQLVVRASGDGMPPSGSTGGAASLMAKRAATVVALRNLAAAVGAMVPGAPGGEWTSDLIKGHRVVSEEALGDGGFRVTVELPVAELAVALHAQLAQRAALEAELKGIRGERDDAKAEVAALKRALDDAAAREKAVGAALEDERERAKAEAQRNLARAEAAEESDRLHRALLDRVRGALDAMRAEIDKLRAELDAARGTDK